jgi:hypothetical protein
MKKSKWTEEENSKLKALWPTSNKQKIIGAFYRSYSAIVIQASKLGIKKYYEKHPYVKSDLSVLLRDTPQAYYWMGFLMADGTVIGNRLRLVLSVKDTTHLLKFQKFCKIPKTFYVKKDGRKISIGVHAQDSFTVPKICSKFDMRARKTYNPTSFIPKKKSHFIAFLAGFIDGDGSIRKQSGGRKDSSISIKLHGSWLNYLNRVSQRISKLVDTKTVYANTNSKGYTILNICNSINLKYLKTKAIKFGLPILGRKWDKIDLSFISRKEQQPKKLRQLNKFKKLGLRNIDIAGKMNVSESWVSINKRRIA